MYPINLHLQTLLDQTISDSRWDFTYLGMQMMIEGVALGAFGVIRDLTEEPLTKSVNAYVMSDEARHVAFGIAALADAYKDLTEAERTRARGVRRRGLVPAARPVPRPRGVGAPRTSRSTSAAHTWSRPRS